MNGGGCRSAPSSNPKDSNTAFDQVVRRETYPRRRPPDQQISSIQEMTIPVPWPKKSSRNPALVMCVQVQLFAYSQRYMAFPSAVLRETTVGSAPRGITSPASASHELPFLPQRHLAAGDEAEQVSQRLSPTDTRFSLIAEHRVPLVTFQHAGQKIDKPPAEVRHGRMEARSASHETPRLTRVTAL